MTAVTIRKVPGKRGESTFRAQAGEREVSGRTLGEALDALASTLGEKVDGAAVLLHAFQPDEHFTAEQQDRIKDLLARRESLTAAERTELEALVDAELDATIARTESLVSAR